MGYQFRFGATRDAKICPPPYLINVATVLQLSLNLFWVECNKDDKDVPAPVPVRDIYRMEFEVFESLGWCLFYLGAVAISAHTCALVGKRWCQHRRLAFQSATTPRQS